MFTGLASLSSPWGAGLTPYEKDSYRLLTSAFSKVTLSVRMSGPVVPPYVVTVRRNGSDTAAKCSVFNDQVQTSTDVTSFSAGDVISIRVEGPWNFNAPSCQQSLIICVSFQ